jgi:hypothetical protein
MSISIKVKVGDTRTERQEISVRCPLQQRSATPGNLAEWEAYLPLHRAYVAATRCDTFFARHHRHYKITELSKRK